MATYKAAIVGAQGYSGRELARLLLRHPNIQLTHVYSRNPEWALADELPEYRANHVVQGTVDSLEKQPPKVDIIFLATPHEVSLALVPALHKAIPWIVDLSGAFRLPVPLFESWYQQTHTAQALLAEAQYGLCPWQQEKPKKIIANPGCYATSVLMALLPLAQHNISLNNVVIDSKSGISGAGRSAKTELLFGEINNNFFPYKIGKHQHTPEIQHALNHFSAQQITPLLTTQVLPIPRGITSSIYIPLNGVDMADVKKAYEKAYQDYPLVRHGHLPELPGKSSQRLLMLNNVIGSCRTHIAYQQVNDYLVVFSMLDNLLKGAASQAVENANRIFNLPLTSGLTEWEGLL